MATSADTVPGIKAGSHFLPPSTAPSTANTRSFDFVVLLSRPLVNDDVDRSSLYDHNALGLSSRCPDLEQALDKVNRSVLVTHAFLQQGTMMKALEHESKCLILDLGENSELAEEAANGSAIVLAQQELARHIRQAVDSGMLHLVIIIAGAPETVAKIFCDSGVAHVLAVPTKSHFGLCDFFVALLNGHSVGSACRHVEATASGAQSEAKLLPDIEHDEIIFGNVSEGKWIDCNSAASGRLPCNAPAIPSVFVGGASYMRRVLEAFNVSGKRIARFTGMPGTGKTVYASMAARFAAQRTRCAVLWVGVGDMSHLLSGAWHDDSRDNSPALFAEALRIALAQLVDDLPEESKALAQALELREDASLHEIFAAVRKLADHAQRLIVVLDGIDAAEMAFWRLPVPHYSPLRKLHDDNFSLVERLLQLKTNISILTTSTGDGFFMTSPNQLHHTTTVIVSELDAKGANKLVQQLLAAPELPLVPAPVAFSEAVSLHQLTPQEQRDLSIDSCHPGFIVGTITSLRYLYHTEATAGWRRLARSGSDLDMDEVKHGHSDFDVPAPAPDGVDVSLSSPHVDQGANIDDINTKEQTLVFPMKEDSAIKVLQASHVVGTGMFRWGDAVGSVALSFLDTGSVEHVPIRVAAGVCTVELGVEDVQTYRSLTDFIQSYPRVRAVLVPGNNFPIRKQALPLLHGFMSRQQAEKLLGSMRVGTVLLRLSANAADSVIASIVIESSPVLFQHVNIQILPDGRFKLPVVNDTTITDPSALEQIFDSLLLCLTRCSLFQYVLLPGHTSAVSKYELDRGTRPVAATASLQSRPVPESVYEEAEPCNVS